MKGVGVASPGDPKELEFEGFRLNPTRRRLLGPDGRDIDLKPKIFDTLVALAARPGQVVSKTELMDAVWPGVVVEENNLNQAISALRKALGDTDGKRLIVTIPGRGYQLAAEVHEIDGEAARSEPLFMTAGSTSQGGDLAHEAASEARIASIAPQAAPASPPPAPAASRKPVRWAVASGLGSALALVLLAVGVAVFRPPDPSLEDRVVFFGFAAEDSSVADVANSATDETYAGLQTTGVPRVARSDALAPYSKPLLDRAKDLGAAYALSGEVRPEPRNGRISISVRLEDVETRNILFEANFQGDAAAPLPLAVEAASMSTQVASCLSFASATKGAPPGREWIPAMAAWCAAMHRGDMETVKAARELARQAPNMASAYALLALALSYNLPATGTATQPGMLAEAQEALKRSELLDREEFVVASARYMLGTIEGQSLIELEADFKSRLQRPPKSWERYSYQQANLFYGSFLQRTGRNRDAVPFMKAAAEANPFNTGPVYHYAHSLALIGNGEAQDRFESAFARYPGIYVWEMWIRSSLFLGIGDPDAMLVQPPAPISASAAQCWRDMYAAVASQEPAAHASGVAQAKSCLEAGLVTKASAWSVLSALGDVNGAFAIATRPGAFSTRDTPAPLFWPPTRAMRADRRFLPLVEKLGLMEYWKASGTRPDVCDLPEEKEFEVCVELRKAQSR